MEMGKNFPVSDYFRENIVDAETISRRGAWWTAVLVIKDPKTDNPFLSIYRWSKSGDTWKKRKSISFSNKGQLEKLVNALNNLKDNLPD